jgi:hypothetical protein
MCITMGSVSWNAAAAVMSAEVTSMIHHFQAVTNVMTQSNHIHTKSAFSSMTLKF